MRATLRGVTVRSFLAAAFGYCVLSSPGAETAHAQDDTNYHSCNGIYTNKECDEVAADLESPLKQSPEKSTTPPTPKVEKTVATHAPNELPVATSPTVGSQQLAIPTPAPKVDAKATAISKSKKDSSLHNLRMKLLKAKRSVGADLDISSAVDVCTSRTTSLEECRSVVAALDDKLEERTTNAKLTKIAEDKAVVEATAAAKTQQNESTVVIVQPNVRATATPFFIFDTGPLLPVEPTYRKPTRGVPDYGGRPGGGHHGEGHKGRNRPPAPAGGVLIDAVPQKKPR